MNRYIFIFLLLFSLLFYSGCNKVMEVVDVAFEEVTISEAPEEIRKAIQQNRSQEKTAVYMVNRDVYIAVTRGEKSTGGYGVEIADMDKVILNEDKFAVTVMVKYTDPVPGQPVTQAVTYPFVIVKTDLSDIPASTRFKFVIDGLRQNIEYPIEL